MITRRQRRHTISPGPAVDVMGSPVIDPSENVLALVDTEKYNQQEMSALRERQEERVRRQTEKYLDDRHQKESAHQTEMRKAETRRLTDLARLRERYETRISDDMSRNVKNTSDILSQQLAKETASLGQQISTLSANINSQFDARSANFANQITTLRQEMLPRLGELDRFRFESGGKTSVQDPATAAALQQLASAITTLRSSQDNSQGGIDNNARMWMIIVGLMAVLSLGYTVFSNNHQGAQTVVAPAIVPVSPATISPAK